LLLGGTIVPNHFENRRWLIEVARNGKGPRQPTLTINNVLGVMRACQRGIGVALLPDYLVERERRPRAVVRRIGHDRARCLFRLSGRSKSVARVQVFRDFLVAKAQRWHF
jgi:DNA-binding transcriptional LysR family regulator